MSGDDLLAYIRRLSLSVFGFDLDEHKRRTGRQLLGLVFDAHSGRTAPLFGEVNEAIVELVNRPNVRVTRMAAGFRSKVKEELTRRFALVDRRAAELLAGLDLDFDAFLIAQDVLREPHEMVQAVTFHEMCHMVEQDDELRVPFPIDPGVGGDLCASLPDPAFRSYHTPEFCDLLIAGAIRACESGNWPGDHLDLVAKAMHYEYEGDVSSAREVLRAAVQYHLANRNAPTFYKNDYLPKIDAMYRNQVYKTRDFELSHGEVLVGGNVTRPLYRLRDEVFRRLNSTSLQRASVTSFSARRGLPD